MYNCLIKKYKMNLIKRISKTKFGKIIKKILGRNNIHKKQIVVHTDEKYQDPKQNTNNRINIQNNNLEYLENQYKQQQNKEIINNFQAEQKNEIEEFNQSLKKLEITKEDIVDAEYIKSKLEQIQKIKNPIEKKTNTSLFNVRNLKILNNCESIMKKIQEDNEKMWNTYNKDFKFYEEQRKNCSSEEKLNTIINSIDEKTAKNQQELSIKYNSFNLSLKGFQIRKPTTYCLMQNCPQ